MNHFATELSRCANMNAFGITANNNVGESASSEANPPRPVTPHIPDTLLSIGTSPPPIKRCKALFPPDINPGDDIVITSEVINSPGNFESFRRNYECFSFLFLF